MAELKYTPVPHDQKAFLAKARARGKIKGSGIFFLTARAENLSGPSDFLDP
jgi:hypothetical protein